MIVKVMVRRVYHKYVEVELEVNNEDLKDYQYVEPIDGTFLKEIDLVDYLLANEDKWGEDIEMKLNEAEFVYGTGLYDLEGFEEAELDEEWRYDCKKLNQGGHL
jgi:hypothetical protein|tara:strand:+ start:1210 stop:1521 length:312 start_codon:yes stop_codon:yes gene_type:complete